LLAAFQFNSANQGTEGYGKLLAENIFPEILSRLLHMIISPEYGITIIQWDRIDACAAALLSLIALQPVQFQVSVNKIILGQLQGNEMIQQSIMASFQKLTSSNGVQLNRIDKRNRGVFVINFREFVSEVSPLVTYQ